MATLQLNQEVIFNTARKMGAGPLREEYLAQVCDGDNDLRGRVLALLQAHDEARSFLQAPAAELLGTVDAPAVTERPGTVIGPYKLMEQIGEGGMGLVFVAEQQQPVRRKVALKIIKPGMDTREVIARFEAERQAVALMDHPNIARVFDAGATDSGRPYFVMELVKGVPIADYCDQNQLTPRERLALFVDVCHAVQHAHTKGIIHRDLKPSNVLIAPHDGKPVVKIIDFGVAKAVGQALTDKTLYTRFSQMIGTPLYMSPEQAEINALDIDTRSDVYGLGVLLYELLTGTTPFDKERLKTAAFDEMRRIIREEEPPKPSTRLSALGTALSKVSEQRKTAPGKLAGLVKGDLDWIVMKALEKDRTRRYETANAFSADVQRYLTEEPVEARPPSAGYRVRKFVRRNQGLVAAAAVMLLTLLLGMMGTTWGLVEALAQRDKAEQARMEAEKQRRLAIAHAAETKKIAELAEGQTKIAQVKEQEADLARKQAEANETTAEWRLYASHIASAQREWEAGNLTLFYHYLKQCRPDFRGWEHNYLFTLANPHSQTLSGHPAAVMFMTFSRDGQRLTTASSDGTVIIWNATSLQPIRSFKVDQSHMIQAWALSPDETRLVTLARISLGGPPSLYKTQVKLWDAASGKEIRTLLGHPDQVSHVSFDPDGKLLAAGNDIALPKSLLKPAQPKETVVKLWDIAGNEISTVAVPFQGSVTFSPDGKQFANISADGVKVWDLANGKVVRTLQNAAEREKNKRVSIIAFSPDGKRLLVSSALVGPSSDKTETLTLWDLDKEKTILTFKGDIDVGGSTISSDGKYLASPSGSDKAIRLWELATGQVIRTLQGHAAGRVAFSPDGKCLASTYGETVKLWDLAGARQDVSLTLKGQPPGRVWSVAFSPDGKLLASGGTQSTGKFTDKSDLKLWDAESGKTVRVLGATPGQMPQAVFPKNDPESGQRGLSLKERSGNIRCVALSPDSTLLASGSRGVDRFLARGYPKHLYALKLWDIKTGEAILRFKEPTDSISGLAFSPDGKRLASAGGQGDTGELKLWDVASGKRLLTFEGHTRHVWSVAFSPDGKLLASGSSGPVVPDKPDDDPDLTNDRGEVRLWDADTGKLVRVIKVSGAVVRCVAFSPTGELLAGASSDGTVPLWNVATGGAIRTLKGHTGEVSCVAFSPDGKRLASSGGDNLGQSSRDTTVRLWDVASGQELLTLRHTRSFSSVAFSPDGKRLASSSPDGTIIIWDASKSMKEIPPK